MRRLIPLLLAALCVFLFFYRLGERGLRNPDEGRYAEIAREMVVSGDWVEPTLYGVDYLRKPVLFYWLVAGAFKIGGFTEGAARAVPAIFGLLGVAATYAFVQKIAGAREALLASLILCTNVWYVQVSRYLLIDAVFSVILVAAFYAFYVALEYDTAKTRNYLLFYALIGAAFLAKGLAALAIPVLALGGYLLYTRRLFLGLRQMRLGWGILVFGVVAVPWFAAIALHEPEFFKFFFLHEHLARFVSRQFEHQEPWYFYLAILPAVFLPWTLMVGSLRHSAGKALHRRAGQGYPAAYCLICAGATVFFYSVSTTKLPTYIVPCIPLLSVYLGLSWSEWCSAEHRVPEGRISLLSQGTFAVSAVILASVLVLPAFAPDLFRKLTVPARPYFFVMIILFGLASVAALALLRAEKRTALFVVMTIFLTTLSVPIALAMEALNSEYTTRHFAEALRGRLSPTDRVYIYDQPGAFYDFAFYLDREVWLVGMEGELQFARGDLEERVTYVEREEFDDQLRRGTQRMYCLLRRSDYDQLDPDLRARTSVVAQDQRKVLFCAPAVR